MSSDAAQEIYPGLWLGDLTAAHNLEFLQRNQITCIINCSVKLPFAQTGKGCHQYRIPVRDNLRLDQIYLMYQVLDKAVAVIVKHLGVDNILVHCHAGRQRSVSVILAFLIKCGQMDLKEALACVQSKRAVAGQPKLNFYQALEQYQHDCRNVGRKQAKQSITKQAHRPVFRSS